MQLTFVGLLLSVTATGAASVATDSVLSVVLRSDGSHEKTSEPKDHGPLRSLMDNSDYYGAYTDYGYAYGYESRADFDCDCGLGATTPAEPRAFVSDSKFIDTVIDMNGDECLSLEEMAKSVKRKQFVQWHAAISVAFNNPSLTGVQQTRSRTHGTKQEQETVQTNTSKHGSKKGGAHAAGLIEQRSGPLFDPAKDSQGVMKVYDKSGDGKLCGDEVSKFKMDLTIIGREFAKGLNANPASNRHNKSAALLQTEVAFLCGGACAGIAVGAGVGMMWTWATTTCTYIAGPVIANLVVDGVAGTIGVTTVTTGIAVGVADASAAGAGGVSLWAGITSTAQGAVAGGILGLFR